MRDLLVAVNENELAKQLLQANVRLYIFYYFYFRRLCQGLILMIKNYKSLNENV